MIPIYWDDQTLLMLLTEIAMCTFYIRQFLQLRKRQDKHSQRASWTYFILVLLTVFFYWNGFMLYSYMLWKDPNYEFKYWISLSFWLPFVITCALALLFTALAHYTPLWEKIKAKQRRLREENKRRPSPDIQRDLDRKLMHLLLFFLMFVFFALSSYFSIVVHPEIKNKQLVALWEIRQEIIVYPRVLLGLSSFDDIGLNHITMFYVFMNTYIVSTVLEMTRNSKSFYMLTNNFSTKLARPKEYDTIMSYLPFFAGVTFVSLILPPIPAFAIITIAVFGDMGASQTGMRWGKHKISWNPEKSWEGVFGGGLLASLSVGIVGPLWGFTAVFVFILIDMLTEKPIPLSDNLLFPLAGTLSFLFLSHLGIPYHIPNFIQWFIF